MKKAIVFFFITLIVSVTFRSFTTHTFFLINQKQIAEKYCVNKEKPILKCHGSCYLKKELKKDFSEKEKQLPFQKKYQFKTISLFAPFLNKVQVIPEIEQNRGVSDEITNLYCFLLNNKLLDPPQIG